MIGGLIVVGCIKIDSLKRVLQSTETRGASFIGLSSHVAWTTELHKIVLDYRSPKSAFPKRPSILFATHRDKVIRVIKKQS